ncbi:unnamed protein product [Candida parapsilosis]
MSDISDSDEEERRSLDVSLISRQILQRKLSHLPNRKRQALENALGRFNTSTPLDVLAEEDEVVEDSDKEASMEVEHIHSGTSPKLWKPFLYILRMKKMQGTYRRTLTPST